MIKSALSMLLCFSIATATLLEGYYRVTNIMVVKENGTVKGFNTTDLFILAERDRIKIAGVHSGIHITREFTIEQIISDTLVLRDTENRDQVFKISVFRNTISAKHTFYSDDGGSTTYDAKAVLKKLSRAEIERVTSLIEFLR